MTPRPYRPRVVDAELQARLRATGAVLIEGPRACGKTATARQAAQSEVLLDVDSGARAAIAVDPSLVLPGPTPRLFDEWQLEPTLWNHIRRAVDERGTPGQFILTGSAVPDDDTTRHTGAGRIGRLRMRPMSLLESGHSTGAVSLRALLDGEPARAPACTLTVPQVAERVCVGGWPALVDRAPEDATRVVRDYLRDVARVDIRRVDGVARDPLLVERLLRSVARNVATDASVTTITADAMALDAVAVDATSGDATAYADAIDDRSPHQHTVRSYLAALERLLVVEPQPAWAPHLRSRSVLRKAPKRHFVDPSLAAAAVGASPAALLRDIPWLGLLFESLVVRDLRVYAQACDAQVTHYRDNTGLEVDAIITTVDGRWGACEVKLGPAHIDTAAETLTRFRSRIDEQRTGAPAFLAVIVPDGVAYRRADGIDVVPVGAMGV